MTVASEYQTTPENIEKGTIDYYRQNGFTRVPGIISKEEAQEFYGAALELSERMTAYSNRAVFTQMVNVWREDPTLKKLTMHKNVAGVAEKLTGIPLRLWHDHILIKQPHNQKATEFHQDQPYWPHANSTHSLSAWIALCDVPVEKGCMTFIPRSFNRTELRAQNLQDPDDLMQVCPDLKWDERVTIPLRAGDCTFHHSRTAHMATPNFTDDPRVAHIVIYMDASTTYIDQKHVVTDPLGLEPGQLLEGEMFPRIVEESR